MLRKGIKFFRVGGFVGLVLLIGLTGPPGWAEEGVTDTEVHIGTYGPLSGPAKLWGTAVQGVELACMIANEAGGVNGRKVILHTVDDAYNPAKTKAGVKKLHDTVGIFAWAGGVGTDNGLAVKDYLVNRSVPWVGPLSGARDWFSPPQRNIFALYPPYRLEVAALCRYAVEKMGKSKIAVVYQDDGYGREGLIGAEGCLKKYNLSPVATLPVKPSEPDLTAVVLKLRQVQADIVIVWLSPFTTLRLIQTARGAGVDPQWMGNSALSAFSTFYPLSRGLIKGMITANSTTYDESLLKKYKQIQQRLAPDHTWDNTYVGGLHVTNILIEGMKACGKNLTRERLIAALEKMQQEKTLGGELAFASFNTGDPLCRLGHRQVYLQKCMDGGQRKFLTNWIKLDDQVLASIIRQ